MFLDSEKAHLNLKLREKIAEGNLLGLFFKVYLDLFADQNLESLFRAVDLEFVSYQMGIIQTAEKPRMVELKFEAKKYLIPRSAFIAQEGQKIFVWLDGRYARALWEGREFLALINEKTFTDLPVKAIVYEAIRVNEDDDYPPPLK